MPFRRLVALAAVVVGLAGCGDGGRPNLVLIVLDTVRADRIRCSEDAVGLTPFFDAFCARSVRFTHAASTSSWTLPAHASLFTGLYPIEHGATQEHTRLEEGAATLAGILADHGYRTLGVSSNAVVSVKSGLARGFDVFEEAWRGSRGRGVPAAPDHPNNRAVAELLDAYAGEAPFFLFVNYVEAHGPNNPPEPHRNRALAPDWDPALVKRAGRRTAHEHYLDPTAISADEFGILNQLYDGEMAYLDALVGDLIERMDAQGQLENTLVVITSDHGENLGDAGHFRHIFSLTGGSVRVPLLIRLPGDRRAGEVRPEPVSLVDVFATLLARAGAELPSGPHAGRDLLAPLEPGGELIAEYYYPNQALGLFKRESAAGPPAQLAPHLRRLRSIELDGLRFVWGSDGRHELYDLVADPEERHDVSGDARYAERLAALRERLDAFVAYGGGPTPLPANGSAGPGAEGAFEGLDPESERLLRELGYLPD